jgi:hypothetical protein
MIVSLPTLINTEWTFVMSVASFHHLVMVERGQRLLHLRGGFVDLNLAHPDAKKRAWIWI